MRSGNDDVRPTHKSKTRGDMAPFRSLPNPDAQGLLHQRILEFVSWHCVIILLLLLYRTRSSFGLGAVRDDGGIRGGERGPG